MRSIQNKVDELTTLCLYSYEYRDSAMICMTEFWLSCKDSDGTMETEGFNLVRGDRCESSKKSGGGVGIFINKRWCNNFSVKEQYCGDNLEYLVI